jgi:hypothetical protein
LLTFTFVARWLTGRSAGEAINLGAVNGLRLWTADGKRIDGKQAGSSARKIKLSKEETTKFQVSYVGVGPDIKEIAEVRMVMGLLSGNELQFYHIKIETEK